MKLVPQGAEALAAYRAGVREVVEAPACRMTIADWGAARAKLGTPEQLAGLGLTVREDLPVALDVLDEWVAGGRGPTPSPVRVLLSSVQFPQWRIQLGGGFGVHPSMASRDGVLGAHQLRRADVPGYLADSVVPHTVFHGTQRFVTHMEKVLYGLDPVRNRTSAMGQGLYTSTKPGGWGSHNLEVAIRARAPFVTEADELPARVAAMGIDLDAEPQRVRRALLDAGHDSMVVTYDHQHLDEAWVIGLRREDMRVVVADSEARDVRPPAPARLDLRTG